MERYFSLYPGDENRAVLHYLYNQELGEALCDNIRDRLRWK
ncbi:hypothetical protein [Bacteroides ovatus]|nr:hypothetical protein [Bacteroides ovatus]